MIQKPPQTVYRIHEGPTILERGDKHWRHVHPIWNVRKADQAASSRWYDNAAISMA